MAVNYNDERLLAVESQKNQTMAEVNKTYDSMAKESDKYYQAQVDAAKKWEKTQTQLQQEQTDFAIEQIEQQKEQAHKDYLKEQSGAYVDWQKESNRYGANAEQMASAGLTNTGYGESSQVSMYNTYQNRVATARDSYQRAVLNYDNAIKDAMLQNNSILAEIAYQSLQQQLELSLAGFQYKNQLVLGKLDTRLRVDDSYHARYQDVLNQINTENALAEEIRQYNASLEEEKRQYDMSFAEEQRQYNSNLALKQAKASSSESGSSGTYSIKKTDEPGSVKVGKSASGQSAVEKGNGFQVNTEYYQGTLNPDAKKYGVYSNGYQPRGISGHGNLSKTGQTIQLSTETLSGKKQTLVQSVWRADDGTFWYWESRKNKYIQIKQ